MTGLLKLSVGAQLRVDAANQKAAELGIEGAAKTTFVIGYLAEGADRFAESVSAGFVRAYRDTISSSPKKQRPRSLI